MTGEEALKIVDRILAYQKQPVLKDLQRSILLRVWEKHSYRSIAQDLDYETDYIKHVAAQLWKLLSGLIGEKVTKANIESIIQQYRSPDRNNDWGAAILMPKSCISDAIFMQQLREKRCLIILDRVEPLQELVFN